MKYDIRRTEEIVYDISLRGLVKAPASSEDSQKHALESGEESSAKRVGDAQQ